jgi:hypothetical protein
MVKKYVKYNILQRNIEQISVNVTLRCSSSISRPLTILPNVGKNASDFRSKPDRVWHIFGSDLIENFKQNMTHIAYSHAGFPIIVPPRPSYTVNSLNGIFPGTTMHAIYNTCSIFKLQNIPWILWMSTLFPWSAPPNMLLFLNISFVTKRKNSLVGPPVSTDPSLLPSSSANLTEIGSLGLNFFFWTWLQHLLGHVLVEHSHNFSLLLETLHQWYGLSECPW